MKKDVVNHPPHYKSKPVECIEISEQMDFCLGNAFKYLYRYNEKGKPIEDLQKAVWYIERKLNNEKFQSYVNWDIDIIKLSNILNSEENKSIRLAMDFITLAIDRENLKLAVKNIKKVIKKLEKER